LRPSSTERKTKIQEEKESASSETSEREREAGSDRLTLGSEEEELSSVGKVRCDLENYRGREGYDVGTNSFERRQSEEQVLTFTS